VFLDDLLPPRESVSPAHWEIMADRPRDGALGGTAFQGAVRVRSRTIPGAIVLGPSFRHSGVRLASRFAPESAKSGSEMPRKCDSSTSHSEDSASFYGHLNLFGGSLRLFTTDGQVLRKSLLRKQNLRRRVRLRTFRLLPHDSPVQRHVRYGRIGKVALYH
jgi:hypothetical protein